MFASAASSERPRDIFREPALSVGIFASGARFAASDDCSQHPGGCAKNFRRGMRTPKLIWGPQAASLPSPSACRTQTLVSTIRFRKLFGERHGTQACGLCAKRTFCPLSEFRGSGVQLRWAHRPGGLCSVPAESQAGGRRGARCLESTRGERTDAG